MRILFLFIVWIIYTCGAHSQTVEDRQPPPAARDVANLAGDIIGNQFHKWNAPPRISLIGNAVQYRPVVEKFVSELDEVLAGLPSQPILVNDNLATADITVYLGANNELSAPRRVEHARSNSDYWAVLNSDRSLKHCSVFIDTILLAGANDETARSEFYTCLMKAFGFIQTKAPKGLIVSKWDKYISGPPSALNVGGLWLGDKKLVRFAYDNFPNGASVSDVKQIVFRLWK